jgi:hypothetical protein
MAVTSVADVGYGAYTIQPNLQLAGLKLIQLYFAADPPAVLLRYSSVEALAVLVVLEIGEASGRSENSGPLQSLSRWSSHAVHAGERAAARDCARSE